MVEPHKAVSPKNSSIRRLLIKQPRRLYSPPAYSTNFHFAVLLEADVGGIFCLLTLHLADYKIDSLLGLVSQ